MLSELIQDRARQQPGIAFSFSGDQLRESYGDSIDLTIYRCMQESLTNAIKHADAKRIDVGLTETVHDEGAGLQRLPAESCVRDDGRGFDPAAPRLRSPWHAGTRAGAGRRLSVESEIGRGTCVRIAIPIPERSLHDSRDGGCA